MLAKTKKAVNDPTRFEGEGITFKAKLIGIEDVNQARGDQMCKEAIFRLKNFARLAGGHKRKILMNVTLEGLKVIDAISLVALHSHPVSRISFISRDPTDTRAFGYIYETEDCSHKLFAIKTATAAEQLVLALKDLFQVVLELKKKGTEAGKDKPEDNSEPVETEQATGDGSTPGDGQTQSLTNTDTGNNTETATEGSTTSLVLETETKPVANLLDFDDTSASVQKSTNQLKDLELDFLANDSPSTTSSTTTSALTQGAQPPISDPWGLSTTETSATPSTTSSTLGDLAGLQTGPFSPSFPVQTGFGGSPSFNSLTSGFSASKDPFGNDPFSSFTKQSAGSVNLGSQQQPGPGFANPFGSEFSQPYGSQGIPPSIGSPGVYGMMPGVVPHGIMSSPTMGGVQNPFAAQQSPNIQGGNPFGDVGTNFQTAAKDNGQDTSDALKARAKSPHDELFGDLLDIKKSSPTVAKSPKDIFTAQEKKSMNKMIADGTSPRASPVPAMFLKSEASPRASPVPSIQPLPSPSPRASPLPPVQLLPGMSPRASPVPTIQPLPSPSPRASPLPPVQLLPGPSPRASPVPPFQQVLTPSPRASPVPGIQAAQAQSSPFDDLFGAPTEQISEKSLFD